MEFSLTEEQKTLQETAKQFAQNEIRPVAAEYDQNGTFAMEIYKKAHDIGLMNFAIPSKYGGPGLSSVDACLLIEELSRECVGITTSMLTNDLANYPIVLFGTEEQKERFLTPYSKELIFGSFGLTEPEAGSDVAGLKTTAVKDGDDYLLTGEKCFITNANYSKYFTIFATLDKSKGHKALGCFIVPKESEGLEVGKKEDKMGQRASDTASVILNNVRVPKENMIGKEGDGFKVAMGTLDSSRPTVAIAAIGVGRAALEHATEYAKERKQFGQPIGAFQGIQFMLANMAMEVDAGRLLTHRAAWMLDNKIRATKESSFAKCFAADIAMRAATDAVQIFGGYGYSKEYPVEKLMRDAKLMQIYEGTAQVQRLVIARELLRS
ncbi:acyl-CoA dehydrogenase family protein [Bdellovibrionota bacterium]